MWHRQSTRSISSSETPLSVQSQPEAEARPRQYRDSSQESIANAEEERTLKDRIRFLTSATLTRNPSVNMSLNFVGSPDFQQPSPSRQPYTSPRRSRSRATSLANSVDHRLSVIDEDQPSPPHRLETIPDRPSKTHNRPFSRRFGLGEPPKYEGGGSPPGYTFWDVTGPKGEKFEDLRNNAYIASRGGWKRICFIAWLLIVIIIALAVGLGVGLSRGKKESSSDPAPPTSSPSSGPSGPFPVGSYTLTTYLSSTSTNCTSTASSWTCQPAMLYKDSPTGSKAQFNWIISPVPNSDNKNFSISSTNNPFSIDFRDKSLQLLDAGLETERYRFETTLQKIVYPSASFNVKCFYNTTLFAANLYTKKKADAVAPATSSSPPLLRRKESGWNIRPISDDTFLIPRQQQQFREYPYAVDATQSIGGGQGVPDCYEYDQKNPGGVGKRVTKGYESKNSGDFCSCGYENWGLQQQ